MSSGYHEPVLSREVVDLLLVTEGRLEGEGRLDGEGRQKPGLRIADCTLGGGGHARALLSRGARVDGIDRDPEAVGAARELLREYEAQGRFAAYVGNFAYPGRIVELEGVTYDAVLLDLGVSSHQIDAEGRGFTFREGAPLDMRMGEDATTDAATLLNTAGEAELAQIFRDYGDERRARRLAREIVRRRGLRPMQTSDDLVRAIRGALGPRTGPADFARLFQAVRIAVNDELKLLTAALRAWRDRLHTGGTLAVISYHSGEDRIVKNAFRDWSRGCICPPRQPVCTCNHVPEGETITRKAVTPSDDEIRENPRARSARLRAWRKVG